MRLTWAKVKNFRSIECAEIHFHGFTSVVGPNNSGKSTLLRAMQIALTGTKPTLDDWRNYNFLIPIEVELRFNEIEDWERNIQGIAGVVYNNEIHLRVTYNVDAENKIAVTHAAKKRDEQITGFSQAWGELDDTIKAFAAQADILNGTAWRNVSNREKVKQLVREHRPDLISLGDEIFSSEGISFAQALQQGLPKPVYVPAVTDASDEAKPGGKSAFGMLLESVLMPAIESSKEFMAISSAISSLRDRLAASDDSVFPEAKAIADALSERLRSLVSASATLSVDDPDFIKPLTAAFGIRLNDGAETPIHLQGHGVQRALIFALLEELAKRTAKKQLPAEESISSRNQPVLLLFEEPELFIHPHLMKKLREVLTSIGKSKDWQVVISTHSPFLIEVSRNPMSLVIVTRESGLHAPQVQTAD